MNETKNSSLHGKIGNSPLKKKCQAKSPPTEKIGMTA